MRIRVHDNAANNYYHRCYRGASAQCGSLHNEEWMETLRAIESEWIEVETKHLFDDQFNTVPIPGVANNGLRLMIEDVAEIEDDVREGVVKCNWCGGYDHDHDGACDKCKRSDHLRLLSPKYPGGRRT